MTECSICLGNKPKHAGLCTKHQVSTGHRLSHDGYCRTCKKTIMEMEAGKKDVTERERVVATAICMNGSDLVLSLPAPSRHNHVQVAAVKLGLEVAGQHEQGFLTSTGRFVRRAPARVIATKADQLIRERISNVFTSEELW